MHMSEIVNDNTVNLSLEEQIEYVQIAIVQVKQELHIAGLRGRPIPHILVLQAKLNCKLDKLSKLMVELKSK